MNRKTLAHQRSRAASYALLAAFLGAATFLPTCRAAPVDDLARSFVSPPDGARPWVYWYFMDGNVSREGLHADLEAMKAAGIGGLTMLHFDSWEMGSQNWSPAFRQEFLKRRGYDPLPWLPAMTGYVVGSVERSERFLWDLRQTSSELVIQNHALRLKEDAHAHGLSFAVEPYDMNPASDLDLGATADLPMGEFWSKGYGFDSEYSCFEAVSVGHTNGRRIIGAESFTLTAALRRQ